MLTSCIPACFCDAGRIKRSCHYERVCVLCRDLVRDEELNRHFGQSRVDRRFCLQTGAISLRKHGNFAKIGDPDLMQAVE